MKKIGLLGLMLCAAGAASAAATGWTTGGFSSQSSTFTVAVAFTKADLDGVTGDLIYIGNKTTDKPQDSGSWAAVTTDGKAWKKNSTTGDAGAANGWKVSDTNADGQWALDQSNNVVNVLSGITDDKTHVIGITVTMTANSGALGNIASYDFYLDGQLLGSLVHDKIGDQVFSYGNFTSG